MAFKVEDGTGYEDSNSYSSVADADAYISLLFPTDTTWAALTDPEKESKLIIATQFVDSMVRWSGGVMNNTQALNWPRTTFQDAQGRLVEAGTIPKKIKEAVMALSFEGLANNIEDMGVPITSQKYGSSSETYAGPVRDGGNSVTLRFLKDFKDYGYGNQGSSMVILQRA